MRAIDKETGDIIAKIELPDNQAGLPFTYEHEGTQYLAMFVGGTRGLAEVIACTLRRGSPRASYRKSVGPLEEQVAEVVEAGLPGFGDPGGGGVLGHGDRPGDGFSRKQPAPGFRLRFAG